MRFSGCNNSVFEMRVDNYEFPHIKQEPYDADWLRVTFYCKSSDYSWRKESACLLTWELKSLTEWFANILANRPSCSEIDFMEPELSFKWFGEEANTLRIYLNYGLLPEQDKFNDNFGEPILIECELTNEMLIKALESLEKSVELFPVRVGFSKDLTGN